MHAQHHFQNENKRIEEEKEVPRKVQRGIAWSLMTEDFTQKIFTYFLYMGYIDTIFA